jgi:hypothetical protein
VPGLAAVSDHHTGIITDEGVEAAIEEAKAKVLQ